tara:strand:- start:401 stop:568 length:168 start_codon:yes stop_codon:yes gene_type:complete
MSPLNETQKRTLPLLGLCIAAAPFVGPVALISGLGLTACAMLEKDTDNTEEDTKK